MRTVTLLAVTSMIAAGLTASALAADQSQQDRGQQNQSQQDQSQQDQFQQDQQRSQDWQDQGRQQGRDWQDQSWQNQDRRQGWQQDRGQQQYGQRQDRQWYQGQQGQQSQRGQQSQQGQGSQQFGRNWQLEPTGWVRVAYDYDGDGRIDQVESIYGFDLERARRQSQQRRQQGGMASGQDRQDRQGRQQWQQDQFAQGQRWQQDQFRQGRRGQDWMGYQGQPGQRARKHRIQGELTSTKTVDIIGMDQSAVVGKIQMENGKEVPVLLGPENKIDDMDLDEGDRVTVFGTAGMVNDRSCLVADRLKLEDGKTVSVNLPDAQRIRRFDGEIQETRTGTCKRTGEKHQFVKVRLENGRTTIVDLGPKDDVSDADLQSGQFISFLAKPTMVNGRPALKADQFRSGGETFDTGYSFQQRRR